MVRQHSIQPIQGLRNLFIRLVIFILTVLPLPSFSQDQLSNQTIQNDVSSVFTGPGAASAVAMITAMRTTLETLVGGFLDRSMYMKNIPKNSSGQPIPALTLINNHLQNYCSSLDKGATGSGGACSNDLSVVNADISISKLISMDSLNSASLQTAATLFTENLIDPVPNSAFFGGMFPDSSGKPAPITLERIQSDSALQTALASEFMKQTLLSVPRHSLAEMIAKRIPSQGQGGGQQQQSLKQLYVQQACQRFMNTTWQKQMQSAYAKVMGICDPSDPSCSPGTPVQGATPDPAKGAQIEADLLLATIACLKLRELEGQERIEALLSALLSFQVRQYEETKAFVASSTTSTTGADGSKLPPAEGQ